METTPLDTSFYKQALIVLGAAGVVIPLFHRLRVSPVLGFMRGAPRPHRLGGRPGDHTRANGAPAVRVDRMGPDLGSTCIPSVLHSLGAMLRLSAVNYSGMPARRMPS